MDSFNEEKRVVVARTAGERSPLAESIGRACCFFFFLVTQICQILQTALRSQRSTAAVITSKITFDDHSPEVHLAETQIIITSNKYERITNSSRLLNSALLQTTAITGKGDKCVFSLFKLFFDSLF